MSAGVATYTINLSANASFTLYDPRGQSQGNVGVDVGYMVSIHAHPYDFRLAPFRGSGGTLPNPTVDNVEGMLIFKYIWKSTSGTNSDINGGSRIYEHLEMSGAGSALTPATGTIDGGRNLFQPRLPPFSGWSTFQIVDPAQFVFDRQKTVWIPANGANFEDAHVRSSGFVKDASGQWVSGSYQAAQQYRFYCHDTLCPDYIPLPDTIPAPKNSNRPADKLWCVLK